jgi:hypothetical protein
MEIEDDASQLRFQLSVVVAWLLLPKLFHLIVQSFDNVVIVARVRTVRVSGAADEWLAV